MTAIKTADVDRFIAKPDSNQSIVLVFGPDAGLVRERVEALVRASVDDPGDPFTFVRIDGDELAGCDDPDCWGRCAPRCPPGTSCAPTAPQCGDGTCSSIEDYLVCPEDCS